MRYVFIINPNAGKKFAVQHLFDEIGKQGLGNVRVAITEKGGDATRFAREEAEKNEPVRIYSCGGDGTLFEVVNGAVNHDNCEIGVIPLGSGNDFVRSFENIPRERFLDIRAQAEGESIPVDLLKTRDVYGINIISCGFDAEACKGMSTFKRLPFISGGAAYRLSVIRCLATKMKHKFRLIADDVEIKEGTENYLLALAANGKYYGGGYKAAPMADMTDGLIDFIRVPTVSIPTFARFVGTYEKGLHLKKMPFCKLMRCKKLQILCDEIVNVNVDGEIFPCKDPIIEVCASAMRIIVPKEPIKA